MDYTAITYEEQGAVALITFNRPEKRNAINVPLMRETMAAVRQANASENVRAILITANGPAFSSGIDFKAPAEPKDESGRSPTPASIAMGQDEANWLKLVEQSKPTIVAVQAAAIGMGVTLILSADMRIAAESATFAFPFLRLGAMPEYGCSALLPRLIGYGRAFDLCLRSATIDAQEALKIGLVTSVHPDAELKAAALEIANKVAGYPPLQMRLTKKMFVDNALESDANAIMRRESSAFIEFFKAFKKSKTFDG
jgi:enoyl-CoA hydratase/carnithine racemase